MSSIALELHEDSVEKFRGRNMGQYAWVGVQVGFIRQVSFLRDFTVFSFSGWFMETSDGSARF